MRSFQRTSWALAAEAKLAMVETNWTQSGSVFAKSLKLGGCGRRRGDWRLCDSVGTWTDARSGTGGGEFVRSGRLYEAFDCAGDKS